MPDLLRAQTHACCLCTGITCTQMLPAEGMQTLAHAFSAQSKWRVSRQERACSAARLARLRHHARRGDHCRALHHGRALHERRRSAARARGAAHARGGGRAGRVPAAGRGQAVCLCCMWVMHADICKHVHNALLAMRTCVLVAHTCPLLAVRSFSGCAAAQ